MRRFSLVIALAASSLLLCPAGRAGATELNWRSWDAGLREAGSSGRPVLVDVYTDWCGWCKRMDRDVYARDDVREYLAQHFVTIKLNAESDRAAEYQGRSYTHRSIASMFGVNGYPTTIFLRSGGDHLVNVPGYVKADRFLLLLRYVGDGALDRGVPFREYERTGGARVKSR